MILNGVVRNIRYTAHVRAGELKRSPAATFDVNQASPFGILTYDANGDEMIGYSKWVSPKRTRSYPFARIYNTYHLPKKVTIIPIIKDEGLAGDLDRINFITFSWMNLMNVYIILAWYDDAVVSRRAGKITNQRFNTTYIHERLTELRSYHQTALHWNMMHFQRDFVDIYQRAVASYEILAQRFEIAMHSKQGNLQTLEAFMHKSMFDLERFKQITLQGSQSAAAREIVTQHAAEYTPVGKKMSIQIVNQLGGQYFLTVDGLYREGDNIVFQEAKNASKGVLPSLTDIQDGLFKLILFANMEVLTVDDVVMPFRVELHLSGNFAGKLGLPASAEAIAAFTTHNRFNRMQTTLLYLLNQEATANTQLSILLAGRV
ncbi:MAG: hypothetical protein DYG88_11810 [Chloroflexi bacterium CFX4]|nr:hypothetical protein [Chloroflexi bacterium CFX4]MDL1923060.1 hypothetical protein [Chloroflexi bacterium CFX3]